MKSKIQINVYEHGRLIIGQHGFTKSHWAAFVKLNEVHERKYFDVLHNGLKFNQYVGAIQSGNLLVQIHPKADKNDEDQKWHGVLLQMLKKCGRLKAQDVGAAKLRKQNINLLEVYFEQFLNEVELLQQQGLIKKYRKQTGNVKALKGKLEFAGQMRHNLVHQERFYTSHTIYDKDHQLHQVMNRALEVVDFFTRSTDLNNRCRRIQLDFPEVKSIQVNTQLFTNLHLDRKSAPYQKAIELAKFILLNYSPDINFGQENMIALLFDMNLLWEEFVLRELKKATVGTDISINGQEAKVFWGSRTIRPDIVISQNGTTIVLDTKWKCPWNSTPSVEDLRQMYAYARFWNCEKVVLLYPGLEKNNNFIDYHNSDLDGIEHKCKVGFVSVLDDGILTKNLAPKIFSQLELH